MHMIFILLVLSHIYPSPSFHLYISLSISISPPSIRPSLPAPDSSHSDPADVDTGSVPPHCGLCNGRGNSSHLHTQSDGLLHSSYRPAQSPQRAQPGSMDLRVSTAAESAHVRFEENSNLYITLCYLLTLLIPYGN